MAKSAGCWSMGRPQYIWPSAAPPATKHDEGFVRGVNSEGTGKLCLFHQTFPRFAQQNSATKQRVSHSWPSFSRSTCCINYSSPESRRIHDCRWSSLTLPLGCCALQLPYRNLTCKTYWSSQLLEVNKRSLSAAEADVRQPATAMVRNHVVDGHLVSLGQFSTETKATKKLFALPGLVTTAFRLPDVVSAPGRDAFARAIGGLPFGLPIGSLAGRGR